MVKSNYNVAIRQLLMKSKNIAVVGLSDKPHRDSYRVAHYMQKNGYKIIPVNPKATSVLGETAYQNLLDIPVNIDIVNVFRRSELIIPVMQEALVINPRAIWLQQGIINYEAEKMALNAGLYFVMDKCIKIEHERLIRLGETI